VGSCSRRPPRSALPGLYSTTGVPLLSFFSTAGALPLLLPARGHPWSSGAPPSTRAPQEASAVWSSRPTRPPVAWRSRSWRSTASARSLLGSPRRAPSLASNSRETVRGSRVASSVHEARVASGLDRARMTVRRAPVQLGNHGRRPVSYSSRS
jgi:hypothetical protein